VPHAIAHPFKIRRPSLLLGCDAVKVVGYRAECACGWRGPVRDKMRQARADTRDHPHHESETRVRPAP
jgi:hypothetical protein